MSTPQVGVRRGSWLAAAACLLIAGGCTPKYQFQPVSMWNESRIKPYEESPIAGSPSSSRRPVPGTVARGELAVNSVVATGRQNGKLVTVSPIPITQEVLLRGQERFNAYCSPCHGRLGDGEGMAVKRGFPHPPDYAIKRLRDAPLGHFFDVMTSGYGVMYSQAERIAPADRWAVAAYLRVLQASRKEVPPDDRWEAQLEAARSQGVVDPARGQRLLQPGHEAEGAKPVPPPTGAAPGSGAAPPAGEQHGSPPGAAAPAAPAASGTTQPASGSGAGAPPAAGSH